MNPVAVAAKDTGKSIQSEFLKAAPPVAVTGWTILGHPITDLLVVVTIIYTICQTIFIIRKTVRDWNRKDSDE